MKTIYHIGMALAGISGMVLMAALISCTTAQQIKTDEAKLPPTAAAVADAYGAIQIAAALGQDVCMVSRTLPMATCVRLQGQLLAALQQVKAVEALVDANQAAGMDATTLAAAQAAVQSVITQLQAVNSTPKV